MFLINLHEKCRKKIRRENLSSKMEQASIQNQFSYATLKWYIPCCADINNMNINETYGVL